MVGRIYTGILGRWLIDTTFKFYLSLGLAEAVFSHICEGKETYYGPAVGHLVAIQ
jgi:hypothetical protein